MVDILLILIYLLLFGTLAVTAFSVWRSLKTGNYSQQVQNRIPAQKISIGCLILLITTLALTFILGNNKPMTINGEHYNYTFWLKAADMFIFTTMVLGLVAIVCVIFGISGLGRKLK